MNVTFIFIVNFNKNLAIANRSHVSCINTNDNTVILKSGLEVTESGAIQELGCGFLFAFYSNYGRL